VGLNAFKPYPVGEGASQFSTGTPAGSTPGFEAPSATASFNPESFNSESFNPESFNSDTTAGAVDERIQRRIEREKQNQNHWAPGHEQGGPYIITGDGMTYAEDGEGGRIAGGNPGPPPRPSAHGKGIGCVPPSSDTPLKPHSEPLSIEIGHGKIERLENDEGESIEEMERMLSGRLSRLDKEDDTESQAYLQTKMQANYAQRNMLDKKVAKAPDHAQAAYRHLIIHLLNCGQVYTLKEWIGMHSIDVLREKLPGGHNLSATTALWDFEESVIQSRNDGEYYTPKRGLPGRSREYRIDPAFAIRFWQLSGEGDPNYKLHRHNGEPNKRARGSAALKTELRDKDSHRWGEEKNLPGGHYSLLDGALRILSDTTHKIDISELTEAKDLLKEKWDKAKSQLGQARRHHENVSYLADKPDRTGDEEKRLQAARKQLNEAKTQKENIEGRYHALLSGYETIVRQADDVDDDGVIYMQNAYEVQDISGRVSFRKGGPQGLPSALKAFSYSMENVYNYDIKSSQTTGLRQLASDLQDIGYDVDTDALDDYMAKGGKDWVTRNYDLPRDLVKRVEHAIKFGGKIPDSMDDAYAKKGTRWGMPAIASHVEDFFGERVEQNRALSDLQEIFGPQSQMIEDLAEGLLTAYWDEHSFSGGRGKGRIMTNHCGITFCKYDYEGGHKARSKAMAWYLQGLEAAYVHAITILSEEYDYEVMANEHDGCITIGTIPQEAKNRAQNLSGFDKAILTDKRFEDEEDVEEAADALGVEMPRPPLELTSAPYRSPETSLGDVPPVGDRLSDRITWNGDRPARPAGEQFVPAGIERTSPNMSGDGKRCGSNAETDSENEQGGDGAREFADHGKQTDADGNPLYVGEAYNTNENWGRRGGDLPELDKGPGDNYDPRYAGAKYYITDAVSAVGEESSNAGVFVGTGRRTFSTVEKAFYCVGDE
jgi:hypothetical protein